MQIAIIIPVHNHLSLTKQALADLSSALKDAYESFYTIVVVDDGSNDGTYEWVSTNYPEIHLLKGDGNLWWSGAVNMGASYAIKSLNSEYILLWNNDILFEKGYFQYLLQIINRYSNDTILGSKIFVEGQPDIVWSMGGYFNPLTGKYGMYGYFERNNEKYEKVIEVDWLTGMGTVVPTNIIEKIGNWDNINFPQYHGDSEFTYRAKLKGYAIRIHPELKLFNKIEHSGLEHSGSFVKLLKSMTDNRSKINFKRNFKFYRLYARSFSAFFYLYLKYCLIFGGYFKWKVLNLFGVIKKR